MTLHTTLDRPPVPVIEPGDLADDPHRRFADLREQCPLVCSGNGQYMVLRAADVMHLLAEDRTMAIPGTAFVAMNSIPDGHVAQLLTDGLLLDNGASHRTKRSLFASTFAYRSISDQRPAIREVADRLVAGLPRGVPFDFIDQMAARLPAEMIAAILGLPDSETGYFTTGVYQVSRAFTPVYPQEEHDAVETAARELFHYIDDHLSWRLQDPQGDFLSTLAMDWQAEKAISFDSLVRQVILLVIAGSDTTRAAFAMIVALLHRYHDQWRALRRDPSLVAGAVMEGLRFEPSVGSMPRVLKEATVIGGTQLAAGTVLSIQNLSAMRDPALYKDPDRFDITRTDHPRLHLVFGGGAHRCLGEMLARIEMEEGLNALLAAAPDLEVLQTPRMIGSGGIRQITPMTARLPA